MSEPENDPIDPPPKRLAALLVDRALGELTPDEQRELDRLLAKLPDTDPAGLERTAASAEIALAAETITSLPPTLKKKLHDSVPRAKAPPHDAVVPRPHPASNLTPPSGSLGRNWTLVWGWAGWTVAAGLLLWIAARQNRPDEILPTPMLTRVDLRFDTAQRTLRAKADDVVCGKWELTAEAGLPEATAPWGELIWSQKLQCGFIHVLGLPPNDPQREHYQVWIKDNKRLHSHPVGAGVFNVGPSGEAVFMIHPRVLVHEHDRFFISREPAGGSITPQGRMLLTVLPCANS